MTLGATGTQSEDVGSSPNPWAVTAAQAEPSGALRRAATTILIPEAQRPERSEGLANRQHTLRR